MKPSSFCRIVIFPRLIADDSRGQDRRQIGQDAVPSLIPVVGPVNGAGAHAIYDATGVWMQHAPFPPKNVKAAPG